eukprot:1858132-Rhodomonas_salina.1
MPTPPPFTRRTRVWAARFYILAPPGLLFGLFDIYLVSPVDKALETKWAGRDFTIGRQLGGGNFGT